MKPHTLNQPGMKNSISIFYSATIFQQDNITGLIKISLNAENLPL